MIKILILTNDRDVWAQRIISALYDYCFRKTVESYSIQNSLFYFEIRSYFPDGYKGSCWSCAILDKFIPIELEQCVLYPCIKEQIIRTQNYWIEQKENKNEYQNNQDPLSQQ